MKRDKPIRLEVIVDQQVNAALEALAKVRRTSKATAARYCLMFGLEQIGSLYPGSTDSITPTTSHGPHAITTERND